MLTLAESLRGRYDISFVMPEAAGGTWLEQARALGCETLALGLASVTALSEALIAHDIQLAHIHAGIGWEGHEAVYGAKNAGARSRAHRTPSLFADGRTPESHLPRLRNLRRPLHLRVEERRRQLRCRGRALPKNDHRAERDSRARAVEQTREAVRASLAVTRDAPLVLSVGRFTEQKGYRYLLEALPRVLADIPVAVFALVGEGPLENELKTQADALGVGENVLFLGRRDDVPDLLGASDLFAL